MVSDKNAEDAAEYIARNASKIASAKANRIYLEEYRKTKKATLVQKATGTIQDRDSFAYAHPDYEQVIEGLREAVREEETLKWMMVAAQAKIEIWRSQQATNRLVDKSLR